MKYELDLSPELRRRVAAIAEKSGSSPTEVVADALENGHSLEWQERFLQKVRAGLAAADSGDFATPNDIAAVRQKYRPS